MSAGDAPPRPGDLARLWLAALGGPPRQRPRDQRADLAGIDLLRALLDRLALLDPEPDAIEPALAEAAASLDGPDGPARALASLVRDQWRAFEAAPAAAAWLIAEAIEQANDPPPRRRRAVSRASGGCQPPDPPPVPDPPTNAHCGAAVPAAPSSPLPPEEGPVTGGDAPQADHTPEPPQAARRSPDDVA